MYLKECLLCQRQLQTNATWMTLFERFPQTICERCQSSFEKVEEQQKDMYSLFYYNEAMQDYLHRYKFMHDTILAQVFRKEIYQTLKNETVMPIPMHPTKKSERTFSHIELLLEEAQIPFVDILEKISEEAQGTKTREERMTTPQLFRIKQQPTFKRCVIFDDIITTGKTIEHAKRLLYDVGVQHIRCVTLITAKAKNVISGM